MADYLFKEFQYYLKGLCVLSKDVLHNDETNRTFFRFQSDEELQAIPNNAGQVCVGIGDFSGRAFGEVDEGKLLLTADLVFLVFADNPDGDPYAAIERAQDKAMQVMLQFYTRMKRDYLEDTCGPLRYLMPEQMTFSPIGPILQLHYGWEMNIPFKSDAPLYDPEKWND